MGIKRLENFLFQPSSVPFLSQNAENMKTDITENSLLSIKIVQNCK